MVARGCPDSSCAAAAAAAAGHGGPDAALLGKAQAALADAAHGLVEQQNRVLLRAGSALTAEAGDIAVAQCIKSEVVASGLWQTFSPQVLADLKSNADQLTQLKQQCVSDKQASKDSRYKLMAWMSGVLPGNSSEQQLPVAAAAPGTLASPSDAVKHRRRFLPFQLGGSSIAGKAAAGAAPRTSSSTTTTASTQGLKFWQVGVGLGRPFGNSGRRSGDTPGDQSPAAHLQRGISTLLFGRARHTSTDGATAAASSRRASLDASASWRSSQDGSLSGRRASARSSDGGGGGGGQRTTVSLSAAARAAVEEERGAMLASLAAGEGPLSKRHSMLATKPGLAQEQVLGQCLERVAEDEREGRDSPVPAGSSAAAALRPARAGQLGLAPLRVPRSSIHMLARHPGSPVESFSFGNRVDEEPHSPSFLRASVSSRALHPASGVSGPLVRSSLALRAGMAARQDPFEAPEPEPQPFVEQLKADAQEAAAGPGLMAALRRSMSGAGARSSRWEGELGSRNTSRHTSDAGGQGSPPSAAAAAAAAQHRAMMAAARQQQQQQAVSEGGADPSFVDLDATRAYALGVHQVMMGLEAAVLCGAASVSEASSKPTTPRSQAAAGDALEPAAELPPGTQEQQQQLEEEPSEADVPAQPAPYSNLQQLQSRDLSPPTEPAAAGGQLRREASDAGGGIPPLQSGLMSPASGRHAMMAASPQPAAVRPLPLMGQACLQMLERPSPRPSPRSLASDRQAPPLASSTSVSLADVYRQTSGNLAPLSSGLSGIGRRPSSGSTRAPQSAGLPPRGGGGPSVLAGMRPSMGDAASQQQQQLGPMSMQQQQHSARGGWQPHSPSSGGPNGFADPAAAAGNRYAGAWGLGDAGSLSRQASTVGVRSQRGTPRQSFTDHPQQQQQQQQQMGGGGAAGRYHYAMSSPRSGPVTPRDEGAAPQPAPARTASAWQRGAPPAGQQPGFGAAPPALAAEHSAAASDSDFASADEQLSSGTSGYASSNGGALNQAPAPASLLSSRPTSAQAAVATQWSPNKNAAAIAQAPAFMREVVMDGPLAREASGLSNPYQAAPGPPAGGGGGRTTPGLSSFLGPSSHDIYAPLPRVVAPQQPPYSAYQAQQLQSAPQQPVVTAVDLARRQSMARRTSGPGHRGSEHDASAPQRRGGPGPQQQLYSNSGSAYGGAGGGYYAAPGSNNGLYSAASSTWGSQPSSRAASGAFGPLAARQPSMQRQQYGLYTR